MTEFSKVYETQIDLLEDAAQRIDRLIPQLRAHHWVLARLEHVRGRIDLAGFKAVLETVLPFVHDTYAAEKLAEFKAHPLRFIVNFTDGGSLLAPLLATREWHEPGDILREVQDAIRSVASDLRPRHEPAHD